jgi:hypothetical protein
MERSSGFSQHAVIFFSPACQMVLNQAEEPGTSGAKQHRLPIVQQQRYVESMLL